MIKKEYFLCYNSSCSASMLAFKRQMRSDQEAGKCHGSCIMFSTTLLERKPWLSAMKLGLLQLIQLSFLAGPWRGRTAETICWQKSPNLLYFTVWIRLPWLDRACLLNLTLSSPKKVAHMSSEPFQQDCMLCCLCTPIHLVEPASTRVSSQTKILVYLLVLWL